MSRTLQGPGGSDVAEQPIQELSALRDVEPPAALVARVMTRSRSRGRRRSGSGCGARSAIEIRLSPLAIIVPDAGAGRAVRARRRER